MTAPTGPTGPVRVASAPLPSRAIMVLRHGKSDWKADDGHDLTRPLAKRGRRSAAAVGRFVARVDRVPDLVLCSPAARARQTTAAAVEAGGWACPVEVCEDLYFGGPDRIVELLRDQPDDRETIMVVGHEPTSSGFIAHLVGGGRHRVATAGLAMIGLEIDRWRDLARDRGRLEWLVPSRLLLAAGI